MTIIRERHAFEGRSLAVISSIKRGGILRLLVVLPDGSRSLVPADWTDLEAARQAKLTLSAKSNIEPSCLGRLADLLQLRKIVDALQDRRPESVTSMEGSHATETRISPSGRSTTRADGDAVGQNRRGDASGNARHPRAPHRPNAGSKVGKGGGR